MHGPMGWLCQTEDIPKLISTVIDRNGKKTIIFVILFTLFIAHMSASADASELQYKDASERMLVLLKGLEENKCELIYGNDDQEALHAFTLDCSKRNNYIQDNKQTYLDIYRVYNQIITGNTEKWSDDARLSLVLFFLTIAMSNNEFGPVAWREIDLFLSQVEHVEIEDWTKNKFKDYGSFKFFFNLNAWEKEANQREVVFVKEQDYISLLILSELNLLVLCDRKEDLLSLTDRRKNRMNSELENIIDSRISKYRAAKQ